MSPAGDHGLRGGTHLSGVRCLAPYSARCSARPWLESIDVPTVILTSHDDPLIDWRDAGEAPCSPQVGVHVMPHGGHMGYLARDGAFGSRRWLEDALSLAFERLATCTNATLGPTQPVHVTCLRGGT